MKFIQIIMLGIIVCAFLAQFWKSIKDFFAFTGPNMSQEALIIVDEPLRLSYFIVMFTVVLGSIIYITSRREKFEGYRKLSFVTIGVLAIIAAIGATQGGRLISDNIMANRDNGPYVYCTTVTTKSSALRATSSPSFWIYSRVPESCNEFQQVDLEDGFQYSTIKNMNQAVATINQRHK